MSCEIDVYGPVATEYKARPIYPSALFAFLAAQCEQRYLAWDCGCGSGQASLGLSEYFDAVIATDPSADQLGKAIAADGVEYRQAPAESTDLPPNSVDLVCAFMAAHWFDLDAFYAEAIRVAKADATIALLVYGEPYTGHRNIDEIIGRFSAKTGPFGGPEIQSMRHLYADWTFPFAVEIDLPNVRMEAQYSMERFLSYTRSRASVMDYMRQQNANAMAPFESELARHWPSGEEIDVFWPLKGRLGKISSHYGPHCSDRRAQLADPLQHPIDS